MTPRPHVLRLAALMAAGSALLVFAQAPTFRVSVEYVEVDARVVDAQGAPVLDLTRDDFELLEDGVAHPLASFSAVNIPIDAAAPPPAAAAARAPALPAQEVATNTRSFDGRLYVLLLDDRHVDSQRTGDVRRLARQFVERHLGRDDLAAVVTTSGRLDASQDFTANRQLLLRAIDRFVGRKLPSAALIRLDEEQRGIPPSGFARNSPRRSAIDPTSPGLPDPADPILDQRVAQARSSMDALRQIALSMGPIHGRSKAVVFLSEGVDADVYDAINNPLSSAIVEDTREATAAATRSNVIVYPIDPRGLTPVPQELIQVGAVRPGSGAIAELRQMNLEEQGSHDNLRALAYQTGGLAALSTNSFGDAFARIVRQSSSYYVLGYYPTNARQDGRFRRIEVRVARPGVEVLARSGYIERRGVQTRRPVAGPAGSSPEARDALNSPVPMTGLALQSTVAAFRGSDRRSASLSVIVESSPGEISAQERELMAAGTLEVVVTAANEGGEVKASDRRQLNLVSRADAADALKQHGVRTLSRLALAPGRYHLRVASVSQGTAKQGSVWHDVEVPDFSRGSLAMSGVLVSSRAAARMPTGNADPALAAALPGPPTSAREFPVGDDLSVFVEIYDNELGPAHQVEVVTTVTAAGGQTVFRESAARSSADLKATAGVFRYLTGVSLSNATPGSYELTIAARRDPGGDPVSRTLRFRITGP
jgi:VWFA-related protein